MKFVVVLWFWSGTVMADSPLPPEGSVCESSLELDRDVIELAGLSCLYRRSTEERASSKVPSLQSTTVPWMRPDPRPASKEVWMVLHSHEGGLSVQMEQGDGRPHAWPIHGVGRQLGRLVGALDVRRGPIQVSDATCMLDGKPVAGIQIKDKVSDSPLEREWVHCFAKERALPPVSTQIFDHGKKSGVSELVLSVKNNVHPLWPMIDLDWSSGRVCDRLSASFVVPIVVASGMQCRPCGGK